MGYGGGQAIFDQHLPLWEKHGVPIWVICPKNDPIQSRYETWAWGHSAPIGPAALHRTRNMLWLLATTKYQYDQAVIFEYDSICLSDKLPEREGFWGTAFASMDSNFLAYRYSLPPWSMTRKVAVKLYRAFLDHPYIHEDGYIDRYLAALAEVAGVPVMGWGQLGYARNTIDLSEYCEPYFLEQRIRAGAILIHGLKDSLALQMITHAYQQKITSNA